MKLGLLRAESIEGQLNGTIPATSEAQVANSDPLIDASSINMSSIGGMDGGAVRFEVPEQGEIASFPQREQNPRDGKDDREGRFSGEQALSESPAPSTSLIDAKSWVFMIGTTLAALGAFAFVATFKRRRT